MNRRWNFTVQTDCNIDVNSQIMIASYYDVVDMICREFLQTNYIYTDLISQVLQAVYVFQVND